MWIHTGCRTQIRREKLTHLARASGGLPCGRGYAVVVIGGDAAGMSAASQARKRCLPDELRVVAFERGRATSYSACGIPYWISGAVEAEEQLVSRTLPSSTARIGIDVRTRTKSWASTWRPGRCEPATSTAGGEYAEPFDDLVSAAGSVKGKIVTIRGQRRHPTSSCFPDGLLNGPEVRECWPTATGAQTSPPPIRPSWWHEEKVPDPGGRTAAASGPPFC